MSILALSFKTSLGLYSCLGRILHCSRGVQVMRVSAHYSSTGYGAWQRSLELVNTHSSESTGRSQTKDPVEKSSGTEHTQSSLAAQLQASPYTYKQMSGQSALSLSICLEGCIFFFHLRFFLQTHLTSLLGHVSQGYLFLFKSSTPTIAVSAQGH